MLPIHVETVCVISGQPVQTSCGFLHKNHLEEGNESATPFQDRSLGARRHW